MVKVVTKQFITPRPGIDLMAQYNEAGIKILEVLHPGSLYPLGHSGGRSIALLFL